MHYARCAAAESLGHWVWWNPILQTEPLKSQIPNPKSQIPNPKIPEGRLGTYLIGQTRPGPEEYVSPGSKKRRDLLIQLAMAEDHELELQSCKPAQGRNVLTACTTGNGVVWHFVEPGYSP